MMEPNEKMHYLIAMDRNEDFERCFVTVVDEMLAERGISRAELSNRVWGGQMAQPKNAWNNLIHRHGATGKPRKLLLREAIQIASAIGYDFVDLIDKVSRRLDKKHKPLITEKKVIVRKAPKRIASG